MWVCICVFFRGSLNIMLSHRPCRFYGALTKFWMQRVLLYSFILLFSTSRICEVNECILPFLILYFRFRSYLFTAEDALSIFFSIFRHLYACILKRVNFNFKIAFISLITRHTFQYNAELDKDFTRKLDHTHCIKHKLRFILMGWNLARRPARLLTLNMSTGDIRIKKCVWLSHKDTSKQTKENDNTQMFRLSSLLQQC